MIICTYEDRPMALTGLKLLVLSVTRHCPDLEIHAFAPVFDEGFRSWARRYSNLRLLPSPTAGLLGWNVKPTLLADRLDAGFEEVVWLDSDIVITRDFRRSWGTLARDVCVVAEEFRWPNGGDSSATRTRALGLERGRVFGRAINSGVIRVTPAHRSLVTRWAALLAHPDYQAAQARPIGDRPLHQKSDQDVLAGLLGSKTFADIPVRRLSPPHDILYCGWDMYESYPLRDRLVNATGGLPPLVHAIGLQKPWFPAIATRKSAGLSPYCAAAVSYEKDLGEPATWMRPRTPVARLLHALALGNPGLRDLPAALAVRLRTFRSRTGAQTPGAAL